MIRHDITIPHGFILPADTNLFELTRTLDTILSPVQRQLQINDIAFQASRILDLAELNEEPRPTSVIFDAFQSHNEHAKQALSGDHNCPLTSLSVDVFESGMGDPLYLVAHVCFEEQLEALVEAEIGAYTPYWDEDEHRRRTVGVTIQQWARRGEAWAAATRPMNGSPSATRITLTIGEPLADVDIISESKAVLAAIPTTAVRIGQFAMGAHNVQFTSPEEMSSFMASIPEHLAHVQSRLKDITLTDLNGLVVT